MQTTNAATRPTLESEVLRLSSTTTGDFEVAATEWTVRKLSINPTKPTCRFCGTAHTRCIALYNSATEKWLNSSLCCLGPPLLPDPASIAKVFTAIENHEPGTPELLEYIRTHCPTLINEASTKFLTDIAAYPPTRRPTIKQLKWKSTCDNRVQAYFVHSGYRRKSKFTSNRQRN